LVPLSSLRPSGQRPAYYYNYARYSAEAKPARSSSLAQLFFCQVQSHSLYVLFSKVSSYCNTLTFAVLSVKKLLAPAVSKTCETSPYADPPNCHLGGKYIR
jgi:hypothetical protein